LTRDFELDITVKEKPVLGVDHLLLLLNYHWARDTSTFPTERHRVQFALILLLLFATGCRPAELVDAKKKKRRRPGPALTIMKLTLMPTLASMITIALLLTWAPRTMVMALMMTLHVDETLI
jgi:integrase